ncbi:MAG: hypothetical protein JK586_10745 [Nocardiopsis sp. BM-2018]|nr:MAG: hypothetical protein JK586_10745 [Nocardiopsis sp. BM-2018]
MRTRKRILTPASVLTVAALALTGCSSTPDSLYDFTRDSYVEPDTALQIEIPDELREAAGEEAEGLLVTSAILSSVELESTQYCAVEIEISYADDAVEVMAAPRYTESDAAEDTQEELDKLMSEFNVDSLDDLEEATIERSEEWVEREMYYELPMSDNDTSVEEFIDEFMEWESLDAIAAGYIWGWYVDWLAWEGHMELEVDWENPAEVPAGTVDEILAEVTQGIEDIFAQDVAESAEVPEWENAASRLGGWSAHPLDDLDESSPEPGAYFAENLEDVVLVNDCAKSPTDEDAVFALRFPVEGENGISTFASAELTVMKNGELWVADNEVNGYVTDTNGNWITE